MSSKDKREGQREDEERVAADGSDPETEQAAAEDRAKDGAGDRAEDTIEDAEVIGETGPDGAPVATGGAGDTGEQNDARGEDPDARAPDDVADRVEDERDSAAADAPEEADPDADDRIAARDDAGTVADPEAEVDTFAKSEFPEQDREIAETGTPPQGAGTEHADPLPDEPERDRPFAPEDAAPASAVSAQPGAESTGSVPPAAPPPSAPPGPEKRGGGGFFPALLGGVIAAGAGFAVAEYDLVSAVTGTRTVDPVRQSIDAQGERLSGLEDQIGQIAEAVSQPRTDGVTDQIAALSETLETRLDDVAQRIDATSERIGSVEAELTRSITAVREDMSQSIDGIEAQLGDVTERLTAVEKRPLQESSVTAQQAFEAYEREVEELEAALAEQRQAAEEATAAMEERARQAQAEVEATAQEAAEAQRQAEAEAQRAAEQAQARAAAVEREATTREALARLDAAIERGRPFETPLSRLSEHADIPEPLSEAAAMGVTSLPDLRDRFPDLAREALDESIRATVDADAMSRMEAFLRAQTGVRSLEPREGDDPDAVLSRAEAALDEGDLETAVSEIGALPDAGQEVLSEWVAEAETRAAVVAAAERLRDTLAAN
mgnify:FL=1